MELLRNKNGVLYAVGKDKQKYNCGLCGLLLTTYHDCPNYPAQQINNKEYMAEVCKYFEEVVGPQIKRLMELRNG